MTEIINYPQVIDPETGHLEVLGKGRIAILGQTGVEKLVTIPTSDDLIDLNVASGDLTYGA